MQIIAIKIVDTTQFNICLSIILNGINFLAINICVSVTHISAETVAIAAPFCANLGINKIFKEKLIKAPTKVLIVTIFI